MHFFSERDMSSRIDRYNMQIFRMLFIGDRVIAIGIGFSISPFDACNNNLPMTVHRYHGAKLTRLLGIS